MKQVPPAISASTSDLSLPFPSTYPVPPSFSQSRSFVSPNSFSLCLLLDFRSPVEFAGGPFGRVVPSSSTAFGGLGSLFPSLSLIDRKGDLGLDFIVRSFLTMAQ